MPGSDRRRNARSAGALAAWLALVLVTGGGACEDSFSPTLLPGAQRLSVWGYLEVTRDTQWIRIGSLRPTVFTAGDSLPVQATLEDLTGGGTIQLRQATVRWGVTSPVDSAATTVHNFWTTVPIRPGASFRFRAFGDVGHPVEALVRVPADYRMEVLLGRAQPHTDSLVLIGLHYVAFVTAITVTVDSCGAASDERSYATVSDSLHDSHSTPVIRPTPARRSGCGPRYMTGRTLSVVGSGSMWQGSGGLEMGDLGPGNITNGVGWVGGTLSKTIPYEECVYIDYDAPCRLHYDSTTVTLTGRVWDPVCAKPVPRALVRLRELGVPGETKLRDVYTDVDGRFWMSALEPGMRYAMTVRRNEVPAMWSPDPPEFQDYYATVVFTSGQQARRDVDLLGHSYLRCPP